MRTRLLLAVVIWPLAAHRLRGGADRGQIFFGRKREGGRGEGDLIGLMARVVSSMQRDRGRGRLNMRAKRRSYLEFLPNRIPTDRHSYQT